MSDFSNPPCINKESVSSLIETPSGKPNFLINSVLYRVYMYGNNSPRKGAPSYESNLSGQVTWKLAQEISEQEEAVQAYVG